MKLKYLVESRGLLIYQRRYPQRLLAHPQIKTPLYKRSLELRTTACEEDILRVWKTTNKQFEDYVSLLELSNLDQLEQARKIELAQALLVAHDLKPGMLAADPLLSRQQNEALRDQSLEFVLHSGVFDQLSHYDHDEYTGGLSPQLEVQSLAWKLVTEPRNANSNVTTISQCWDLYSSVKVLRENNQNTKMARTRFERFVRLIGDQVLTQQAANQGLITYAEARENDRESSTTGSPTEATIHREINAIVAVLNTAIKRRGLNLVIQRPALKKTAPEARYTYTRTELVQLAELAQNTADSLYAPWKELTILFLVQTGVIQSELQRLRRSSLHLDHQIPHIDLRGELKTSERERPNPIVYRLQRIKELVALLDDGSPYVFGKIAMKEPKTVNKALVRMCQRINSASSPYSCRHAFKNNALGAGVNPQLVAALGGWSGKELGFNSIMADYGKTGLKHLETLEELRRAMLKINAHLMGDAGRVVVLPLRA